MTLSCRSCGSSVRLVEANEPTDDGTTVEHYECVGCGSTGSYEFGDGTDRMTGCLTDDGVYGEVVV